ncbi:MAG: lysophospholipid acyltransferase family protein [Verrucomicrobia bacterium]|nr:lysophospholipid acyltransferase family protein [Verrucomicrobiota bacterium]
MPSWKKAKRSLRRPFETGGFVLLKWIIPSLPRSVVVGLSKLAGRIVWLLPLREKQIGLKNIEAVFGDTKTAAEKRFILTTSFAAFTQTMLDVFWFSRNPEKRIPKYVEFSPGFEPFFRDQAHIGITAHFGSWEMIPQAMALRGADLASIAASIKNKQIDKLICQMREQTGQTIIPRKGALRTLVGRLRKKGKVGFALDQNTPERNGGIAIDFLGLPTPVSSAPAALAYRTGTELFFVFCIPLPRGKYRLYSKGTLQPPAYNKELNADAVAKELTQQIIDRVSGEIRNHPEFWLWSYRHWRRDPGKTYPPNYPEY